MSAPRSFLVYSTGGFLLAAAAGTLYALDDGGAWWAGLAPIAGPVLAASALLAHAWAIRRGKIAIELATYAALVAAFAPYASGAPTAAAWALAVVAAAGVLVAVESAAAFRRLAKLEQAEGAGAHLERIVGPLRTGILVPLAVVATLVLAARFLGKAVLGLTGASVADSVEAGGLYGITFGAVLLAALLGTAAFVRHARQDRT